MKSVSRLRPIALALAALLVAPASALPAQSANADRFRPDNPHLAEAVEAAQATLPLFLDNALDRAGEGLRGSRLLILLGNPPDAEPAWVSPYFKLGDKQFEGHISAPPDRMTGYMIGERVPFDQARILDWEITLDDGLTYGAYLQRARIEELSADSAAKAREGLSPQPVPEFWD